MDYTGLSGLSIKTVESVKSVPFFLNLSYSQIFIL